MMQRVQMLVDKQNKYLVFISYLKNFNFPALVSFKSPFTSLSFQYRHKINPIETAGHKVHVGLCNDIFLAEYQNI